MPRKKVPKRKVKEVTLPDGDEGCDLPVEAKKFKLESFIEQFDYEVEQHIVALEKECNTVCAGIGSIGRMEKVNLNPTTANMPVSEYFKSLTSDNMSSQSNFLDDPSISSLINPVNTGKKRQASKRKVKGFATPAVRTGKMSSLWTATPKVTPMLDKRLLNVVCSKPTGFSTSGS